MATPSALPSTINTETKPQSPHMIPSDEESISSQAPIPPSIYIDCIPHPLTKFTPTYPINATLHKNSIKPISIRTLNLVYRDANNLPPIPP